MTAKFVEVKTVDSYSEGTPGTELVNYFAIHRIQAITGGIPFKNGAKGRLWFGRDEGINVTGVVVILNAFFLAWQATQLWD